MAAVSPCLSVIVPSYNEEATIAHVVRKVLLLEAVLEVIVVNDCSRDRTVEIVQGLMAQKIPAGVRLLQREVNKGKTAALKTGFAEVRGEIVIVQDADLEYDPSEIPEVIQPILDGQADVVYGSRFLVRKASRVLYFYHFLANKALTFTSNLFTNINLTDVETGYKAFRSQIMRNMTTHLKRVRSFEIEVTAKVVKLNNVPLYEVPDQLLRVPGLTSSRARRSGPWMASPPRSGISSGTTFSRNLQFFVCDDLRCYPAECRPDAARGLEAKPPCRYTEKHLHEYS